MDLNKSRTAESLGILFLATICIAIGGTHYHVVGAMVKPLGDAYGWSRGDIAFALTISAFVHPFTNIAVGMLVDRFNARLVALPGIVLFALGTAVLGLAADDIWTWYACYIAFSILGSGVSSIIYTKLVVQHFTMRRGIALATSLAGTGVLVSTIPSIVLMLENAFGLNGVYPALALCAFVLMFIPAWLFLPRDNDAPAQTLRAKRDGQWRDLAKSSILWRLSLCFLIIASCVGTFIVHFQPMLVDSGLSRADAATVALFIGPAMIIGRLGTGVAFDFLPTRAVAGFAFSLPAFACLWLWLVPLGFTGASALAILIGVGMGSEVDVVAYLSSRYFGLKRYGMVFAILISVYSFGVGTSSWVVGKVYDVMGNYDLALVSLTAAVVGALLLVASIGRPPPVEAEA